jgi:hypothetical protein
MLFTHLTIDWMSLVAAVKLTLRRYFLPSVKPRILLAKVKSWDPWIPVRGIVSPVARLTGAPEPKA